ncbi:alpha/beta fold hydrolase [Nocardiopsis alba]|uniref:Alpha/beta hydrolase fold family protein n=1 Tax=Nocardiopsis alba (strain ATCC BAA-2165 / BE74) TaxID=1205910 RepID=J7LG78_NOCAA|nr:alpha/beta hydrolase [Nocardiopsis alba]AFR10465.1 alpha/beta hydrolase fold family protein [Nocardiopsis alba ATCC BAA-2165]
MSTPEFLDLPPGVRRTDLSLSYGPVAALRALPTSGGTELSPAVLVHGFTGSKEDFIALLQSLAQAGREVVAIDLPGTYRSPGLETLTPPPGVRLPDYRLSSLGEVVSEVLDQVGDGGPVHLVGHSFGGLVSREAALVDRSPLGSLTLMCSGPGAMSGAAATRTRNLIAAVSMNPTSERLRELWDELFEAEAHRRSSRPEIVDFLRDRLLSSSAVGLLRMAEDLLGARDRVDELAEVDIPKLVLYGENDDAWPTSEQDDMAARLGARRLVIPGAGHSPNVEAPETTSSALTAFWNETESVGRR